MNLIFGEVEEEIPKALRNEGNNKKRKENKKEKKEYCKKNFNNIVHIVHIRSWIIRIFIIWTISWI